jgi:beta-lactamase class A
LPHQISQRLFALAILCSTSALAAAPPDALRPAAPHSIAPSVSSAVEALTARQEKAIGARIGVGYRLIESGEGGVVGAATAFPMASTYKVAIAGTLLTRVDRGEVRLDQMVPLTARDMAETGEVANRLIHPGISLSVANLMELMLTQSNNTATDKMLALAGGPAAVTAWLRGIGITAMRVDRTVNDLLVDFYGLPAGSASSEEFERRWASEQMADAAEKAGGFAPRFEADPRDSTTPGAMVDLLAKLFTGSILKPDSRDFLIGVMTRCETGKARLKGLLPAGTIVAHKTGTIGGVINDVGMITLPEGRGHLLVAIYTKGSAAAAADREHAIAEISRSLFDYFTIR